MIAFHRLGRHSHYTLLVSAAVCGLDDILQGEQRIIRGNRFLFEDIKAGALMTPSLSLINPVRDDPTRGINQVGTRFHQLQLFIGNHVPGMLIERNMDRRHRPPSVVLQTDKVNGLPNELLLLRQNRS